MATERLAPDAILEQTNLTGAVTAIDEDPDSPDSSWLSAQSNNADSIVRVSFPTPTGNLTGTQEFRVLVRKLTGQSGNPTCRIELYQNGVAVSTVLADTTVTSTTGVVLAGTFSASGDGSTIECRVFGTKTGGSPGTRNTIEVGAIEWNVQYQVAVPPITGTGATAFPFSTAATASLRFIATGAAAFGFASAAEGTYSPLAITGTGGVAFGFTTTATGSAGAPAVTGTGGSTFAFATAVQATQAFIAAGASAFGFSTAASGVYTPLAITATGNTTFGFSVAAEGTTTAPSITGSAATTFGWATSAEGTYTPRAITGTATSTFGFAVSAAGASGVAPITGSSAVAFGFATAAAGEQTFVGTSATAFGFAADAEGTYTPLAITGTAASSFTFAAAATATVISAVTGTGNTTFRFAAAGVASVPVTALILRPVQLRTCKTGYPGFRLRLSRRKRRLRTFRG